MKQAERPCGPLSANASKVACSRVLPNGGSQVSAGEARGEDRSRRPPGEPRSCTRVPRRQSELVLGPPSSRLMSGRRCAPSAARAVRRKDENQTCQRSAPHPFSDRSEPLPLRSAPQRTPLPSSTPKEGLSTKKQADRRDDRQSRSRARRVSAPSLSPQPSDGRRR